MRSRTTLIIGFLCTALAAIAAPSAPSAAAPAKIPAPPNEPARVEFADGRLTFLYAGKAIFDASVAGDPARATFRTEVYRDGDRIEQVVLLFGTGRDPLRLQGTVRASEESFPCEADRRDRRGAGPVIVRHVSGVSRSLLNRAVYDRRSDWVVSVDAGPAATVLPAEIGPNGRSFALRAQGNEIVLRFRPRFYQKHRGLPFFEPWTYRPWPGSVAGWISWFAFYDAVTERTSSRRPRFSPRSSARSGMRFFRSTTDTSAAPEPRRTGSSPTRSSRAGSSS